MFLGGFIQTTIGTSTLLKIYHILVCPSSIYRGLEIESALSQGLTTEAYDYEDNSSQQDVSLDFLYVSLRG